MKIISDTFQTGDQRYSTDYEYTYKRHPIYFLNQRRLASLVGTIAIFLPIILFVAAMFGVTCFYHSISHFYYSRFFGDFFVVSLAFIGTFLIAFRGTNKAESRLSTIAGLATYGIALFPTSGIGCADRTINGRIFINFDNNWPDSWNLITSGESSLDPFDLFFWTSELHYICALVLFSFLAWYALVVFTRVDQTDENPKKMSEQKINRNRIYWTTGLTILFCMVMLGIKFLFDTSHTKPGGISFPKHWTFIFEAIALMSFGFAWMTKGRFWNNFLMEAEEKKQLKQAQKMETEEDNKASH